VKEPAPSRTRTLDLRPDCLSNPTVNDVDVVGVTMLFPDDDAMRQRILADIMIELALLSGRYPEASSPAERQDFFELIRSISPVSIKHGEACKDAFMRGTIAGALLYEIVGCADPGKIGLGLAQKRIARRFGRERISSKTISNSVWPKFRCVAVYWAAYAALGAAGPHIPCRPSDLGVFLAMADQFRELGENTRTPHSPEPLLRTGETIIIPPSIELPRGKLRFRYPQATPLEEQQKNR
jgi:hypothetical protein